MVDILNMGKFYQSPSLHAHLSFKMYETIYFMLQGEVGSSGKDKMKSAVTPELSWGSDHAGISGSFDTRMRIVLATITQ